MKTKRIISSAICCLCLCFAATTLQAQTPTVSISVDEITNTGFTASFHPENCTQYSVYSDIVGGMDMWIPMMGSVENIVSAWGLSCSGDATHTWNEMQPGTMYVIYALATDGGTSYLYTDTVQTNAIGGSGESIISLSVDNITDNSVQTTATPNDQTLLFKDFIIEKAAFDTLNIDTVIAWLKDDPYIHYETDVWTWLDLKPGTPYYLCGIGMNGDSIWGEMSKLEFSTTGTPLAISSNNDTRISVFPNPTSDNVVISGISAQSRVFLYDMNGRQVHAANSNGCEMNINTSDLARGSYLLQIFNTSASAPISRTIILQ